MKKLAISLLVVTLLPVSAVANPVDNYAVNAINAAKYDAATAQLETHVRADPADETAWLNLALAYRHTGRTVKAIAAYRRVMTLENALLDTASGNAIWSHDVARRFLASDQQITSR